MLCGNVGVALGMAESGISSEGKSMINMINNDHYHHKLVMSRRSTVVTQPLADIAPERITFLKGELGKWDAGDY